jgi:hypothetical protein
MPNEPTKEQIAKRAYDLFLARGSEHGRDVEDWLAAEQQLRWLVIESHLAVASEIEKRRRDMTAVPDAALTV